MPTFNGVCELRVAQRGGGRSQGKWVQMTLFARKVGGDRTQVWGQVRSCNAPGCERHDDQHEHTWWSTTQHSTVQTMRFLVNTNSSRSTSTE